MKKLFLVAGTIALLAAGCTQSASLETQTTGEDTAMAGSVEGTNNNTTSANATSKTSAKANVKVNNVDDALTIINRQMSEEQTAAASGNDSDLTTIDGGVDSYTGVPNETY